MGVIHKLKPEIVNFILDQKKRKPSLGCRPLTELVNNTYKITLSKSSVNAVLKESGCSMPVGRRRRLEDNEVELSSFGVIFLKAADFLIGGVSSLASHVRETLGVSVAEAHARIESVLYEGLFDVARLDCGLSELVGSEVSAQAVSDLRAAFESKVPAEVIQKSLLDSCQRVGYIVFEFSDGNKAYCDPQFHTIWSSPERIPAVFEAPLAEATRRIQKLVKGEPAALFMAPGYDKPTAEFVNFLSAMEGKETALAKIAAHKSNGDELFICKIQPSEKPVFLIGFWPWQFLDQRVLEFNRNEIMYTDSLTGVNFKLEGVRYGLNVSERNISLNFPGIVVKTANGSEPLIFVINGNRMDIDRMDIVLSNYFSFWGRFTEALKDFSSQIVYYQQNESSKISLATKLSGEIVALKDKNGEILKNYLNYLNLFVKFFFLPNSLENSDFSFLQSQFYSLRAVLHKNNSFIRVIFLPSPGYLYAKELSFACQRLNERDIFASDGRTLKFSIS
ncbi:MAG TPA: hypothetical protein PKL77_00995 [Candidatus Omnitrophota bacterium]|nr:hypothetical protein [Candidatus Omnitrophota bacterium]HPT07088.1 hypothetical protein [Candidatus Omnitrophota bacterium]